MKCMLEITIAPEVIAKFKELLVEEDNEDCLLYTSDAADE